MPPWSSIILVIGVTAGCKSDRDTAPVAARGSGDPAVGSPWATIASRAAPHDPAGSPAQLLAALELSAKLPAAPPASASPGSVGVHSDAEASQRSIAAQLVAWAHDHGGLPSPAVLPDRPRVENQLVELGQRALGVHSDDVAEADLYLAQTLRRHATTLLGVMAGIELAARVCTERKPAPAVATRYAPSDDDVVRAFLVDALYTREIATWRTTEEGKKTIELLQDRSPLLTQDLGELLALDAELANAPADRTAFASKLRTLATRATPSGPAAVATSAWPTLAERMYRNIDSYRGCLAPAR